MTSLLRSRLRAAKNLSLCLFRAFQYCHKLQVRLVDLKLRLDSLEYKPLHHKLRLDNLMYKPLHHNLRLDNLSYKPLYHKLLLKMVQLSRQTVVVGIKLAVLTQV